MECLRRYGWGSRKSDRGILVEGVENIVMKGEIDHCACLSTLLLLLLRLHSCSKFKRFWARITWKTMMLHSGWTIHENFWDGTYICVWYSRHRDVIWNRRIPMTLEPSHAHVPFLHLGIYQGAIGSRIQKGLAYWCASFGNEKVGCLY